MIVATACPSIAHAGNDGGVLLGDEAALVSDGAATWYTPAGIAAVDRDSLDLSGSAMLRIGEAPVDASIDVVPVATTVREISLHLGSAPFF